MRFPGTTTRPPLGSGWGGVKLAPAICFWGFLVVAFRVYSNDIGDFRMQSAYPLSRCPACKKAFRMEITRLASPPPNLGLIVCPHCGLKFQRFDPQYLKGARPQVTAR